MSPLNRLTVWRADVSGAFFLLPLNVQKLVPPKVLLKILLEHSSGAGSSDLEVFSQSVNQLRYLDCLITLPIKPVQFIAGFRSKFCIFIRLGS